MPSDPIGTNFARRACRGLLAENVQFLERSAEGLQRLAREGATAEEASEYAATARALERAARHLDEQLIRGAYADVADEPQGGAP